MNSSSLTKMRDISKGGLFAIVAFWTVRRAGGYQGDKSLAEQIFETMIQLPGTNPAYRTAHAKGVVCKGRSPPPRTRRDSPRRLISREARYPVIVRFSMRRRILSSPTTPPSRAEWRFDSVSPVAATDIVSLSHNGFIVGTGEDFLTLQKAIVATDPSKPHPWPVEAFIASHPLAGEVLAGDPGVPSASAPRPFSPMTHSSS